MCNCSIPPAMGKQMEDEMETQGLKGCIEFRRYFLGLGFGVNKSGTPEAEQKGC